MFGLGNKTNIYVADIWSNIAKACYLAGIEKQDCIAHAQHNLVMVDDIAKMDGLKELVDKVKDIVKTCTCKTTLLEKEGEVIVQEKLLAELVGDDKQEVEYIGYGEDDGVILQETAAADHVTKRSATTTLKKDCPTQWNSVFNMVESFIKVVN